MARMTTARVSRTRSSSRCWASGIFGSSIGEKTLSWRFLKKRLTPLSAILPAPLPHPPPRGGRDGWGCSSRVDHDEQGVALAAYQKDRILVLLDLGRCRLEVLQPGDRLTVDFLDHVPALQAGLLRRAPGLHVGDHHAGRLRPDVELRPGLFIDRPDAQIGQELQGRLAHFPRFRRRGAGLDATRQHGVGGTFANLDRQQLLLAVPDHLNRDLRAHRRLGDAVPQLADGLHFLAVELHDYVAALEAGFEGRSLLVHVADQGALLFPDLEGLGQVRRDLLDGHAQPPADDLPDLDAALGDRLGERDRHGEPDAFVTARPGEDRSVDADELPFEVHQRAAGVPRVDGRIGLDEVLIVRDAHIAAPQGADDAHRDGLRKPEGAADRQDDVAHLELVVVAPLEVRQVRGFDLDDRQIGLRIHADDLGRMFLLVRQIDLDVGGAIDHVVVGHDVAVRIDDHAGPARHVRTGRAAEGNTWFRLLLLARRLTKRTGPTKRSRRR